MTAPEAGTSHYGNRPSLGRMLARASVRHCPRCGSGRLFESYFRLRDHCPGCDYLFAREEGFWLGAFVVNFVVAEGAVFLLMFAFIFRLAATEGTQQGSMLSWLVMGVVLAVVTPIVFYPFSKTIWAAVDIFMQGARPDVDRHGRTRRG
ncbi:MAG: hypothetical protein AVDCRST_MAG50-2917 [uncultured Acidimicrobiales bacterium]|uniref:DUF983 domain-containing protein n=1 Tax=uncultured Acidimicrobiales bacterium TaxID=310071 RepID=A0A6J4IUR9_9ACTN|nr:MAG: hypothetical protein AVDCRST_MAG50-2917 [uncultured Acidimicrobiales bacterium]